MLLKTIVFQKKMTEVLLKEECSSEVIKEECVEEEDPLFIKEGRTTHTYDNIRTFLKICKQDFFSLLKITTSSLITPGCLMSPVYLLLAHRPHR